MNSRIQHDESDDNSVIMRSDLQIRPLVFSCSRASRTPTVYLSPPDLSMKTHCRSKIVREAVAELLARRRFWPQAAAVRNHARPGTSASRVQKQTWRRLEQRDNELNDLPLSQLMLTTGSQQLLSLVTQALFNPGDICLVAAPTYFVYIDVLQAAGAEIVPVIADADGMRPDALAAAFAKIQSEGKLDRVRLVYVVSDFDNPSGVSVSAERRPEILRIVQQYSVERPIFLLEDCAYRELRYDGDADSEHLVARHDT